MRVQLTPTRRLGSVRSRLGTAAWVLLATGLPAAAAGATGDSGTQLDTSLLTYGEQGRAKVIEPTVRVSRLFQDGQTISGQIALDVITGASPSGALPSGVTPPPATPEIQTVTTASGGGGGQEAPNPRAIPVVPFSDVRAALDADWLKPFGPLTPSLGGHFSRERDYQSVGANAKLSLEMLHKLTTVTVGAAINRDDVFPSGGTREPLADTTVIISTAWNPKNVNGGLVGISQILTRRWMLGVTASRSVEDGYLTEPYKVVSIMDPVTGITIGQLTENRPTHRDRHDVLTSTVYHLNKDVIYLSHRYYWDDWGVHSNTIDGKYRIQFQNDKFFEPHLRYYWQTQADFYRLGLIQGEPAPTYISADQRLGPLRTATIGANYGFTIPRTRGEFTIRAEYIVQFGKTNPNDVVGVQQGFDLMPPVNIGTILVTYSVPL